MTSFVLPDRYLITPEPGLFADFGSFLGTLSQALGDGIRLVQLRSRELDPKAFFLLAERARAVCAAAGARLVLNGPQRGGRMPEGNANSSEKDDGIHLTSLRLMACHSRPADGGTLVSASCHGAAELAHAASIGVSFVTLSPVQPTRTHPLAEPLGWERFAELAASVEIPVFALGGMTQADLQTAQRHGAHGIASIRGLWPAPVG